MTKVFRTLIVLGAWPLLFAAGCTKKPSVEVDNETQSTIDNAIIDQEFMVIVPALHATYYRSYSGGFGNAYCDSLSRKSGDTQFGTPGHVDPTYVMTNSQCNNTLSDGRIRTGRMVMRLTGPLNTAGSKMIIKLQDYRSDGISYSCDSMVATVVAIPGSNSTKFSITLVNGVCQSSSFTIKYAYTDRSFTTDTSNDPLVSVYGTSHGITRDNRPFSVNIAESSPLVKHRFCRFIDRGRLQITPDGFKTREVDFGNGNCDDDATFSVNGNTVAFKLK